jgi:hypothetical protein
MSIDEVVGRIGAIVTMEQQLLTPVSSPAASSSGATATPAASATATSSFATDLAGAQTGSATASAVTAGYVNPLAGASVRAERIDQGVDYAGTGSLSAIGPGRVSHVATEGTGWPGAFIEYQLIAGPDAGCFVFYAEGVQPVPGLHVGQTLAPGQDIATVIPGWSTGIEIGWGSGVGTKSLAAQTSGWTAKDDEHSVASESGLSFSALIVALGGPPGKKEG